MTSFRYIKFIVCLILIFSGTALLSAAEKTVTANGLIYFYGYPFNTPEEIQTIANTKYIHRAEISIEWKDVFISRNEFDWSYIDKNIEIWKKAGKSVILRIMTANNATYCTSDKLVNKEKIRLVADGIFTDFESNILNDGYSILNGKISGDKNKFFELRNNKLNQVSLLQLNENKKLLPNVDYLIQFDFKGIKKINGSKPVLLKINIHSASDPSKNTLLSEEIKPNGKGLFSKEFRQNNSQDYTLTIETQNVADCNIDNLNIIQSSESRGKRVAFPDYFSDNFKSAFTYFMNEMAKRYNTNPAVDAIVVSGVGRWEEMLLNDNEKQDKAVHESFYRQWHAYGYTDVNYLKNVVEWSMNLTKRLFPQKELILQISPMNNGYENEDFIYRRAAAMAVSKGISIKQNGMSEKYDTWSATSDPAYIMNRYRFNPQAKRYYETAGQIFRNTMNAMGHPESLFNRVIIDGATNLYLYKSDILEPNVQHYFKYADSLMHHPFISKLYTNLGLFPLANRKKQKPHLLDTINYYNKWLGIRQYEIPGASPTFVYDSVLHVHAASTNVINPNILFDVDDRVLYNGMASAILTVTYKDWGSDSFDVLINSRKSGMQEIIGTIDKNNSNLLCRKSIPLYDFLESADNWKETKPEIWINDKGDGIETISNLEIEFVPLHNFETELLLENKATTKFKLLGKNESLTDEITCKYDKPLAKAEIMYYDGDFSAKSDVTVSLNYDSEVIPVVNKQYYIGGDKEWIPLRVACPNIPKQIQLKVLNNNGVNGAYVAVDGSIAYKLYTFKLTEKPVVEINDSGRLAMADFFQSYTFNVQPDKKSLKFFKLLPDNSFLEIPYHITKNKIYFSPQHPGIYKLEINKKSIRPQFAGCLQLNN